MKPNNEIFTDNKNTCNNFINLIIIMLLILTLPLDLGSHSRTNLSDDPETINFDNGE